MTYVNSACWKQPIENYLYAISLTRFWKPTPLQSFEAWVGVHFVGLMCVSFTFVFSIGTKAFESRGYNATVPSHFEGEELI